MCWSCCNQAIIYYFTGIFGIFFMWFAQLRVRWWMRREEDKGVNCGCCSYTIHISGTVIWSVNILSYSQPHIINFCFSLQAAISVKPAVSDFLRINAHPLHSSQTSSHKADDACHRQIHFCISPCTGVFIFGVCGCLPTLTHRYRCVLCQPAKIVLPELQGGAPANRSMSES